MMPEWKIKIQAIYLNSRQYMKNTEGDWEKVFAQFRKVLKEYDNDPSVMDLAQEMIIRLENFMRTK